MRGLLAAVMADRWRAALAAVATAFLALLLPPLSLPSGAVVALVTLVHGAAEGMLVTAIAAGGGALTGLVALKQPWIALAFVLGSWLPAVGVAAVVRATRSLALGLWAAAAMGAAVALLVHLALPDPRAFWQELLASPPLREALPAGAAERLAGWMGTLLATGTALGLALVLLLARGAQAVLYNPGGLARELRLLRPGRVGAALTALCWGGGIAGLAPVRDVAGALSVPWLFGGLGVLHALAGGRRAPLVAAYVALALVPHLVLVLAGLGWADAWLDLRRRLAPAGTPPDRGP